MHSIRRRLRSGRRLTLPFEFANVLIGDLASEFAANVPVVGQVTVLAGNDGQAEVQLCREEEKLLPRRGLGDTSLPVTGEENGFGVLLGFLLGFVRFAAFFLEVEESSATRVVEEMPHFVENTEPEDVRFSMPFGDADGWLVV